MTECFLLGVLGSVLGVAAGAALALGISAVGIEMPPPPNADLGYTAFIRLVPGVLAAAFVVGTFAGTLAGVMPSIKIARIPPVEALRKSV
jgi:putative ABC transport system permease protein